jgi:cytochrome c
MVSAAGDADGVLPYLDREKPMLRTFVGLTMILLPIITAQSTSAVEFGAREEAKAMVKRVQDKFKRDGAEATFKAITEKSKAFHDRDLYPFVYELNGVNVAHGAKPELVGKNLIDFKDQNGKFLIREMIELVNDAGGGWVNYRWASPSTNNIEDKSAYVEKMGQYFVGVGVYQADQMNQNTVAIVSGSPDSDDTSLQMAYDLAAVLNDGDNLRVVPVVGIGGPQNIRDVRGLSGVDLGLTQTSILNDFRRSDEQLGSFDNKYRLVKYSYS